MPPTSKRSAGRPRTPLAPEDLVQVATRVFAERGYAGASLQAIAEQAGIRKASLFHHFPSKRALYDAVFTTLLNDLGGMLEGLEGPWLEQLDLLGDRVVHWLGTHGHASRLLMREIVSSGPVLDGATSPVIRDVLAATAAFLAEGMRQGVIARSDPAHLAMSIIGLHLTWFAASSVSSGTISKGRASAEIHPQCVSTVSPADQEAS